MTESVTKMGYRMDESDKWFDEKALQLDNLDTQLRKIHTSVGALIHHRKLLTVTTCQVTTINVYEFLDSNTKCA